MRYSFNYFTSKGVSKFGADGGIRTPDPLITNQLLWPTELHRQNSYLFR